MRTLLLTLVFAIPAATLSAKANPDTDGYFRRDRNIPVAERQRPDYDASPMHLGGLLVDATLQAESIWSDNIYATNTSKTSDLIAALRPWVDLTTSMDVHAVKARLFADYHRYLNNQDESTLDGGGRLTARLDFAENTSVSVSGHYEFLHEPRSSIANNIAAKSPIAYTDIGAAVVAQREFGMIRALIEGGYVGENFYDAQTIADTHIEQDYRDHGKFHGRLKIDYALSPSTAVFAHGRYESITFNQVTLAGLNRDQSGYVVELGADFDISNLTRGQIGVGYLTRQFNDTSLKDISGLSVDAQISWFPSPLLTVTADAGRHARISGLAASPAYVELSASARVDYEMRQNILLFAQGQIGQDSYDNISLTDSYTSIEGGALWFLNRNLAVSFSVRRRNGSRDRPAETGSDTNFSENRVDIALVARP